LSDVSVTAALTFAKGLITPSSIAPGLFGVSIVGDKYVKSNELVGLTDAALGLAALGSLGWLAFHNLATSAVPPNAAIVITQGGTPGTTIDQYVVVAHFADGSLSASPAISTATAPATLNGTNYNIITWAAVTGATSYDVYRTSAGGTPSTTGKIATGVTSPYNDQGAAGDSSSVPVGVVSQFPIQVGSDGTVYPNQVLAGETIVVRWNGAAVHRKAITIPTEWEYLLIEK